MDYRLLAFEDDQLPNQYKNISKLASQDQQLTSLPHATDSFNLCQMSDFVNLKHGSTGKFRTYLWIQRNSLETSHTLEQTRCNLLGNI